MVAVLEQVRLLEQWLWLLVDLHAITLTASMQLTCCPMCCVAVYLQYSL